MNANIILPIAATFFAFTSCGEEKRKAEEGIENEKNAPALQAEWKGYCEDAGILPLSASVEVDFDQIEFRRTLFVSSDGSCNSRDIQVSYSGEYSIGEADANQQNIKAKPIDLHYKKAVIKPLTDFGVKTLNTVNFCGETNYAVNEEKDVSSRSRETGCPLIDLPESQFDIVSTEGGIVRFGATGIKSAPTRPEDRPTSLNGTTLTKK